MSSGGDPANISSILTGRPSKQIFFEDYKDKDEELEKIMRKLFKNCINELNLLTISIKGHTLAIKDIKEINGETFVLIQNPWGSGESTDIDSTEPNITYLFNPDF